MEKIKRITKQVQEQAKAAYKCRGVAKIDLEKENWDSLKSVAHIWVFICYTRVFMFLSFMPII